DITPTLLDAAGVQPAQSIDGVPQSPFNGHSLVPTFADANAPEIKRAQYFEMFGNVGIWKAGWKAVIPHRLDTWNMMRPLPLKENWALYDLNHDLAESHDLATKEPERLRELKAAFAEEARENNVLPLMNASDGAARVIKKWAMEFQRRKGVWDYPG